MLHDVRNPLNALSINVEVLAEKLKCDGAVPPAQEKNLKAIREQVHRIDALLRQFSEFMVAREVGAGQSGLSDAVTRALQVLGHEGRRRRLKIKTALEPGLQVKLPELGELPFVVLQPLLRGLVRSSEEGTLQIAVRAEGSKVVYEVVDEGGIGAERSAEAVAALSICCQRIGVELQLRGSTCRLLFPRA